MPTILAQVTLKKDAQYITLVVAYYEELDQPQYQMVATHINQPEPYKMIKYSGQAIADQWEYEYCGKAKNRLYIEVGRSVMEGWQYLSGTQNFPAE
jgi:hypothetical protein